MAIYSAEFDRTYERSYGRTINWLYTKGLRSEEAHKFAQQVWARGWQRRLQLRDRLRLTSFVSSITLNEFRTSFREHGREQQFEGLEVACESNIETHTLGDELPNNSSRYGAILKGFYTLGCSANEIAWPYKRSGEVISVRLSWARQCYGYIANSPRPNSRQQAIISPDE